MQMQDNLFSIIFVIFYLMVIWVFLFKLILKTRRENSFNEKPIYWKWSFSAYFLLAFGDLFHLGFRIIVYFAGWGPDYYLTNILFAIGYIITGITMTYFYIAIFHMWSAIYGDSYSTPSTIYILMIIEYAAFLARIFLIFLPFNRWYQGDATVDFGFDFRIISSIPIYVVGIITVYLLLTSSRKELKNPKNIDPELNKGNFNASIWYIVSYVTYSITNFFVAIYPLTGLFMIPKTIAYLLAFYYHYKSMLNKEDQKTKGNKNGI